LVKSVNKYWVILMLGGLPGISVADGPAARATPQTSVHPALQMTQGLATSAGAANAPGIAATAASGGGNINADSARQHAPAPVVVLQAVPAAAEKLPPSPSSLAATKPATTATLNSPPAAPASAAAGGVDAAHLLQASLPAMLQPSLPDETLFPHYASLKTAVAFWTQVFAVWSENQSVLHSMDDLGKIYTVLDFRDQAAVLDPVSLSIERHHAEAEAWDDTRDLLKQVDALQATPQNMTPEQHRIFAMFSDSSDPQRFKNAIDGLRFQRGLRERTQHALAVSGRYMPQMEQIFASYDLPKLLTRLPLMESSFDLDAYSKAGAAGVWQFIPSSARIYMRLNNVVDDRRDPWFSTDAAARHLKDDYDALRDWPLALTAYNFGRGGLSRALAEVNGTSLLDVIARYENRRFGFASRNYYAEFLAATDVERNWRQHFGDMTRDAPVPFELVETRDYVRYETLRRLCGLDEQTFHTLNPAFRDSVIEGKLYVPPAHPIRVPLGTAERFRVAYAALGADERFDRQRQLFVTYHVQRGDNAEKIAQRYGVSVASLLGTNGLRKAGKVHAGQTLRIPGDGSDAEPEKIASANAAHIVKVSETVTSRAKAAHGNTRTCRVEVGQTLSSIARRYQTTVQLIRKFNGLRGDDVRAGTLLKIPA
jgi:membrane-bound lytic murein transglycosylase D